MGYLEDFDDRHISLEAEQAPFHPYEYKSENNDSWAGALPVKQGLYDPEYEKDACGVGFAAYVTAQSAAATTCTDLRQPYQGQSEPQDCVGW